MSQEILHKTIHRQIPITELLKEITQQSEFDAFLGENLQKHLYYQNLLFQSLPIHWHHRLFFAGIEKGQWLLWVADSVTRFQLEYLTPTIAETIAKHLPRSPKLKVQVRPGLWREFKQRHLPVQVPNAREYSPEQAKLAIERYLAKH